MRSSAKQSERLAAKADHLPPELFEVLGVALAGLRRIISELGRGRDLEPWQRSSRETHLVWSGRTAGDSTRV